jgi:DNA helicase-2/ATP-dependent DNA helicase PcrA
MNFYHRHEIKVLLDYLRVIADPYSEKGDEALSTILNIPNRYISRKFVQDLERKATEKNRPMYDLLKSMQIQIPYIRKNVKEFMHLMDPLIDDVSLSPAEVINLLRIKLDYDRVITEDDIPSPDDSRIQNINQLQMASGKYHSIPAFLEYTDSFSESATVNDAEGVSLMTIHKAKGLDFKIVMIVGLVEGILPSKKGDMEEERRICFVGMSRAMELLYLYHSQTYLGQPAKKSTFIDEASGNKSPDTTDEITVNQIAA